MIFQAIPQVPAPPAPPDFGPVVGGGPPDWIPFLVIAVISITGILIWPLIRAAARRIEGKGGDAATLRSEIDQLHERLAEVEQMQQRVLDLENRLEFSERLLTQQREALLQRPENGA